MFTKSIDSSVQHASIFRRARVFAQYVRPPSLTGISFSADVTSCSLINQHCWISRIFSQNVLYLDDISSLITIACCVAELRTIEFRPFPIENVLGGGNYSPPSTFSMGNRQNSLAHNSCAQQANVIKLEIPSKYLNNTFWEKIRAIQQC